MRRNNTPPRLGCFSLNGIAVAVLIVLLVTGISLTQGGVLFSPGALNAQAGGLVLGGVRSHAEINRCSGCHPAPFSGQKMTDACLACHTDLKQDPQNFHNQMVAQGSSQGCIQCHVDHTGAAGSLVSSDLPPFPHNTTGFSLKAHQKMATGAAFTCADCHVNGFIKFDQTNCASCHKNLDATFMADHTAAYGLNCRTCHDGLDTYGRAFDHSQVAFVLTGKHQSLSCSQCHNGARSIPDMKALNQACEACHAKDDAHQGDLGKDCAQCHNPGGWQQGAKIDHNLTKFPLTGKHQSVDCTSCHQNKVFKGTPTDCYSCHSKDDTHQGDLGKDCAKCHVTDDWKEATIDHSLTSFPLAGKHLTVECTACHVNDVFKGTPTICSGCHAKNDIHKGSLGQDCSVCHSVNGWLPITFDHAKSAFPLTGRHQGLPCAQCHVSGPSGVVFKGTPTICYGCHADPNYHQGLFGTNCVSCHSTGGWIPAKFDLPHSFDLHHGGANSCRDCHPSSLSTSSCTKCHGPGGPESGGGG